MTTTTVKLPKGFLTDVYFSYTCIATPKFKYESKTEKEYSVNILLSKEQAKAFKSININGLKINKTVKEISTEDFEKSQKFPPPYPDQDSQYIVTLTQNLKTTKGDPLPDYLRPVSYKQLDNGATENITDVEIGNGSFGDVSYTQYPGKKGITVKLSAILVKELVPYVKANSDPWAAACVSTSKPSASSASRPAAKQEEVDEEIDESDLPF